MKNLLLFFLILSPFSLFAQESDKPFKNANLIIIETTITPETALKQLAFILQDHGYYILRFDKEINSFLAEKPEFERVNYTYQVQASIREQASVRIHIFGNYKLRGDGGETLGQASFEEGIFKHPELDFFENINKIAKAFPGGRVKYSKLL